MTTMAHRDGVALPGADPATDIEVELEDGILRLRGHSRAEDDVRTVSIPITRPVAPQATPVTHRESPVP